MYSMRIKVPVDVPSDPANAYRRGWRDALTETTRKAGQATSDAKAAAARANGKKGGRPRKSPVE